jgi:hypothetical protein
MIESTSLMVPLGDGGEDGAGRFTIDLNPIFISEARQDEVATVTPVKAPELLAEFNRSWRDIHAHLTKLEAEKNKAEKALKKRKGILILEVIPARLKELEIASAADTRQAVIDTDTEYLALSDRFDQLKAAIMFLKGKAESFENAYSSVKKIMGEDAYNHGAGRGSNPRLSGDTTPSQRPPQRAAQTGGSVFGNPKF